MNILHGLNEKQIEAVRHKDGPLLVIAGPGTGKTKVITHRIANLINEHKVAPGEILAITFTHKAAQEMQERINNEIGEPHRSSVRISTFHAFCNRTLRKYASLIQLDEDFTIVDQEQQENILDNIVQKLNFKRSDYKSRRLLNFINNLKRNLQELTEISEFYENGICITDGDENTKIRNILELYQRELEERNAVDFDDLIFKTVALFKKALEKFQDESKNSEKNSQENEDNYHKVISYIKEISYILVDEYHDVNEAQYQLLQLLVAPPKGNLMVVADKDQAIYSWRGSSTQYIDKFQADFTPHTVGLEQHYRCRKMILDAAKEIITRNLDPNRPLLKTDNPIGEKIVHCTFCNSDKTEEAQNIITLIRNLKKKSSENIDSKGRSNTIAILYRNHEFADVLTEQLALQNDMPFRRWIQSINHFQETYRKAIVSYLSLVESKASPDIERAINFPKVHIDELTLVQLKRIARQKKIGLAELFKDIEEYPQEVGPLTRHNIHQFWEQIHKFVADAKIENEKASKIVPKLLDILEFFRSPYRNEELEIIENQPETPNIANAQKVLHSAVENDDRIHIIASYGIDEYCAAHILRQTLETYLNQTVQIQFLLPNAGQPQITEKGVYLLVGDFDELEREYTDTHILLIGTLNNSNVNVIQLEQTLKSNEPTSTNIVRSITTLKLCQGLIGRFEVRNMENIVIYDLETTGVDPEIANIVEIAACHPDTSGKDLDYHELVKPPDGHIPKESTEIHKITEEMVEDKPGIAAVLPQFYEFIQDSILVGHNISQFDNLILGRVIKEHLEEDKDLTNFYYDTLVAARRLFPHERRNLGSLAKRFDIMGKLDMRLENLHSAGNDVAVNREVFKELIAVDSQKRRAESLAEFLPLVGLGILAKIKESQPEVPPIMDVNVPIVEGIFTETDAFLNAARRFVQTYNSLDHTGNPMLQADSLLLEQNEKTRIRGFMKELRQARVPNFPEDVEWKEERTNMIKGVRRFEEISADHRLQSFINYQTRVVNAVRRFEKISNEGDYLNEKRQRDETQEQLTLMSLHTAKGTEFDVVIIIGMEDENFPQTWNPETLEEERRLFYVGMTRAKKRLYLCTNMYRFYENQGDGFSYSPNATYSLDDQDQATSMFIHEIPSDYIHKWISQQRE